MKRTAALVVLAGLGTSASAFSLWTGAAALAGMEMTARAETAAAPGLCIGNFSKDDCEGRVSPGHVEHLGCDQTHCRTIRVREAVYETYLRSSGLGCGLACESRCDEFPNGKLVLKFDYVLRNDSCCPYRGSWNGRWEFNADDGRVFAGTAHGTIGVGTNRESRCPASHDACEKCYDVDFDGATWLIGIEGSFQGVETVGTGATQDELHFTTDSTWLVDGNTINPFGQPFRTLGRFDGSHLDYCP